MKIIFPEFVSRRIHSLIATVVITAVSILGINGVASASNTGNQDYNVLNQQITLQSSIDATIDVKQAIMTVAVLSSSPINVEYLFGSAAVREANKNPIRPIAAGTYTLKAILEAIQRNYPKVQWFVVGQGVFVRLKETDDLQDPLDLRLSTRAAMTLSISDWSDWLYKQHPSAGFACYIPHNNKLVTLSLSPKSTIREVFEKIAEQAEGHWVFTINPNNHITSVATNGSDTSASPITNSKNGHGETTPTATGDQWGRTQVRFFPRFEGSSSLFEGSSSL